MGSAEISDYPVVYCNSGFAQMTGFKRSEVMKLSCDGKFLLGSFAKKEVLERIRDALRCKTSCQEEFIGRKKDGIGLTYWGYDIVRIFFYRENDGGERTYLLLSYSQSNRNIYTEFNKDGGDLIFDLLYAFKLAFRGSTLCKFLYTQGRGLKGSFELI